MQYNTAIDSFRALSILLVLFFHAFPAQVPAGFIGVDLFFIISGYLITKNIVTSVHESRFGYWAFYKRRIVRLFPALLVMLTITTIMGWCFLSDTEYKQLAQHTISSLGFFQNFNLLKEIGYFDVAAEYKPLLHLWSLSVEEQFNLIWPLIILTVGKEKSPTRLILQFTLASLFLNLIFRENQSFNFYFPLTRIWEFSLGGFIVYLQRDYGAQLAILNKNINKLFLKKEFFVAFVFLIFIAFSVFVRPEYASPFLISAILLWACAFMIYVTDANNDDLKTFKVLSYVGLISYPLYLYHWPIFVLLKILRPDYEHRSSLYLAIGLILAVTLSILTYEFVEKPFKKQIFESKKKPIFRILIVVFMVLVGLNAVIIFYDGFPSRYKKSSPVTVDQPIYQSPETCIQHIEPICEPLSQNIFLDQEFCEKNISLKDNTCELSGRWPPSTVVLGDSHAASIAPAIAKYFKTYNRTVLALGHSGTVPFVNTISYSENPNDLNGHFNFILNSDEVKTVILSAYWHIYYSSNSTDNGFRKVIAYAHNREDYQQLIQKLDVSSEKSKEDFKAALSQTLSLLNQKGKKVFILLEAPTFYNWKSCADRPLRGYFFDERKCTTPAADFHQLTAEMNIAIKDIATSFKNTHVIDPSTLFCDHDLCHASKDKVFLYHDASHLNSRGADYVVEHLLNEFMDFP